MTAMTFDQTGDFVAVGAARAWLQEQGCSWLNVYGYADWDS